MSRSRSAIGWVPSAAVSNPSTSTTVSTRGSRRRRRGPGSSRVGSAPSTPRSVRKRENPRSVDSLRDSVAGAYPRRPRSAEYARARRRSRSSTVSRCPASHSSSWSRSEEYERRVATLAPRTSRSRRNAARRRCGSAAAQATARADGPGVSGVSGFSRRATRCSGGAVNRHPLRRPSIQRPARALLHSHSPQPVHPPS